ncbi:MAG: N-acetyl sugar amidotransferase [Candidatus Pelagibacter sp.]
MSKFIIEYPKKLNKDLFKENLKKPQIKYGLPGEVIYCQKCVISNQRPSSAVEFKNRDKKKEAIKFDKHGVCDACNFAEMKNKSINWEKREKELIKLCEKFRNNSSDYDCLVPGSGGKDSFYAAHILKYKYGMNPLTVTWAPNMYTDWGFKNFQSWIHAGFDNILITPNGIIHRLLTRLSVEKLFHPFQPFILGQKFIGAKIARKFGIKLVLYGENEVEYGNPISNSLTPSRNKKFFTYNKLKDIYLAGISYKDLINKFKIPPKDLATYLPDEEKNMHKEKVEVHYLGYYLKWHPQYNYYYSVKNGNFQISPERTPGTYSRYSSIDDKIDDLHYYTTGIKFGIGRSSYDASQEIRSEDINRNEGINLVKKYDIEFPKRFEKEIFDYLSVDDNMMKNFKKYFQVPKFDRKYLNDLSYNFRSPHIWVYKNKKWFLRNKISK